MSNAFLASIKITCDVPLFNVVSHINGFPNMEPPLYSWNKSYLVMRHYLFNTLLDSIYLYLFRTFIFIPISELGCFSYCVVSLTCFCLMVINLQDETEIVHDSSFSGEVQMKWNNHAFVFEWNTHKTIKVWDLWEMGNVLINLSVYFMVIYWMNSLSQLILTVFLSLKRTIHFTVIFKQ